MRVFLDTNVVVGAVATRGLCADVLRDALAHHDLIASEVLLDEIHRVLVTKLGVPTELASEVVTLIRKSAFLSEPSGTIDVSIEGAEDRALVLAAMAGRADLFVTGDRKLLKIARFGTMEIVSPRIFWERVRASSDRGG
jgi:putative PIN family toxin of toxin-antitoxin system